MTKIYLSASLLFLGAAAFAQQFSPSNLQVKQINNSALLEMPKEHRNNPAPSKLVSNDPCGEKYLYISKFDSVPPKGWTQIKKSKNNVGDTKPEWQLRKWPAPSTFTALDLPTTIDRVPPVGEDDMVEVDDWVISPDVDIPAGKKVRFVFTWSTSSYWNAKGDPEAKNDYADVEIKIAVGGGATDTSVYDPAFYREDDETKVKAGGVGYPYTSWVYYTSTYDLSAYAGKKINLAIHGMSRPKGAVEFIISELYLEEVPSNDLKIAESRVYSGPQELGYTRIPLHQMAPISFESKLTNRGALAQPNTMLSAHVYKDTVPLFNKKSAGISLEPGIDSILRVTETNVFDPIAAGVDSMVILTVYEEAISDSTECLGFDNIETLPLFFNDSIYARDLLQLGGGFDNSLQNWAGGSGQAFRIGNLYEIFMAKNLPSVLIGISADTQFKEQLVYAQIHKYNEGTSEFELLIQSKDYTLTATDVKNQLVSVEFETPVKVEKGDLLLVTAGHYGGPADGSEDVAFMSSGTGIQGEILGLNANNEVVSLIDPPIPVVRLNFGAPDVSVADEKAFGVILKDLYPSPANEVGFIGYEVNKATTVKFRIFEASGKIVKEWNEGLKNNGKYTSKVDLGNLNPGLYFYSLVTERGVITKRFSLIK